MTFKVVVTQYQRPPSDLTTNVIREAGIEVEWIPAQTENEVITAAKDADVILVGTVPHTTRKVLEALPKLKMVGRSGVGVDSIDLDAATELGICNVELIFTVISDLSWNGGQAITGNCVLHATTPERALLLPATVI